MRQAANGARLSKLMTRSTSIDTFQRINSFYISLVNRKDSVVAKINRVHALFRFRCFLSQSRRRQASTWSLILYERIKLPLLQRLRTALSQIPGLVGRLVTRRCRSDDWKTAALPQSSNGVATASPFWNSAVWGSRGAMFVRRRAFLLREYHAPLMTPHRKLVPSP